jgi:MraZ protein
MFTGKRTNSKDSKGRVAIPAKMRDVLRANYGPTLMVTRGLLGSCLWLFPLEEWAALKDRISDSGVSGARLIRLKRLLYASAEACEMDKAGRILIPDNLAAQAELEKELIFVGMDGHIEVWNPKLWMAEEAQLSDSEAALLEMVEDIVF